MEKNNSFKVIDCFILGPYTVMALDRKIDVRYTKYQIDGKEYKPVPCYDLPRGIAIEAHEDYLGKTVYLV